jgi:Matrixin
MTTAFSSRRARAGLTSVVALLLFTFAARSSAFVVNAYMSGGQTLYLKWGDNHAGTVGGTVTWSFIPAGTPGSAFCAEACPGISVDSIEMEISPGGGFALTPLTALEAQIMAMMDHWSAVSGIRFVKVADSGLAINDPGAVPPATGQIRIGVFVFGGGGGEGAAVGYSPPPNSGTGAGNILFNANAYYQNYPLAEGTPYGQMYAPNDFQGLVLHEFGHAVGLEHPPYDGTCPVMCVDPQCPPVIKRQLRADDIAGVGFLYGTIFTNGFE